MSDVKYWPNDPSYAYGNYDSVAQGKPGQWWLYSFVPERAPTALLLRQPGLASGLSVDAAWRYGTGESTVLLAVLDDGIDALAPELVNRIVFNLGELLHSPPLHQDQSPCAPLVPGDPTSPRFDCAMPADGEVTVEDFREALEYYEGGKPYDPNQNGVLDIYDVVQRYQNQRDDDNNGLQDDIIGWNFAESNGLPNHVVTRHGTEAALDAVASTGDGVGRAGVCPKCRLLPIRVADQRGADPQKLALGILYAATRGASAALVAHLPLGRSETLERAIQNAAQRGTLVIFPRDGERQRHAPLSFDFDAWLSIGGLTTRGDGNATTLTTSFVEFDPCQAFAPGPNYVGSGPSCGRVAPSVVLGVAGLVASTSQVAEAPTKLTALELASTLKWSADSIDTNLTSPSEPATPPQPSVRRINANAAVEAVRAGLIPPELNLERPVWHEPILLDKLKSPLSLIGRLSATRADSIELSVSAANGRSPADTEFQDLSSKTLVDAKAATDGATLATVDLRGWYESTHSSQDGTSTGSVVTLRVTATARYAKLAQSTTALVERRIVVLQDRDILAGSPIKLGSTPTAPKLADVDGDTQRDIILGTMDGRIMALSAKEGRIVEIATKPIQTAHISEFGSLLKASPASPIVEGTPAIPPALGRAAVPAAPAIADLDADGQLEIVVTTLDGHIYAVHSDGTSLAGPRWPIELPPVDVNCRVDSSAPQCASVSPRAERGISSSPVIADMNADGKLDIVVAAHDGRVHVYKSDGLPLDGWPVLVGMGSNMIPGRLTQAPAVADFDGDGVNDLLVTAGEERSKDFARGMHVLILGSNSGRPPTTANGWPVTLDSYDVLADRIDRSTPGASIDSSTQEIQALLYGNSSQPFFLGLVTGTTGDSDPSHMGKLPTEAKPVSRLDGQLGFDMYNWGAQASVASSAAFAPMVARPSIGDLDRDGMVDVVLPGLTLPSLYALRNNAYAEHQGLLGMFSGDSGRMLPAAPISLKDFIGSASAAIADVTNDGYPEVIVADGSDGILAVDACGRSAPGWPKVTGSRIITSPAIGDVDGDGLLEVVATTEDGWLYVWKTQGLASSYIPWGSALNDNLNQSHHRDSTSSSTPSNPPRIRLDDLGRCDLPTAPPEPIATSPRLSARGGCACELLQARRSNVMGAPLAILGALAVWCSRRRTRDRRRHGAAGQTRTSHTTLM